MAKKCTKKCDAHAKLLFGQSKPIAFLTVLVEVAVIVPLPITLTHFPSLSELLSSQFNIRLGVNGFPVFEESNKFFLCWFSNCWPYKHLLYNFLAWFPFPFLSVLIFVLLHIALSLRKVLLFPPFLSLLLFLPSRKLISVLSFQGSQ